MRIFRQSYRQAILCNEKTGAGLVKLTAILTETNKDWNVNTLFEELKKEREQMAELKAKKE